MTRDDVLQIFAEASDAQLDALMQLHEADMAAADGQTQQLAAQLQEMRQQEEERRQEMQRAQEQAALEARFDAAVGERRFVHDAVRRELLQEFIEMRLDPANEATGDRELLHTLTDDAGCFAQQYRPVMMADMGDVAVEDLEKLSDAEYYAAIRRKHMR